MALRLSPAAGYLASVRRSFLMARRRRRSRRTRGFVTLPFSTTIAMSTANSGIVVLQNAIASLGESFYAISADIAVASRGHTQGEGPLQVGMSHGDLTVTEIKEAIESDLSDPNDIIQKERSRRPVRTVGYLRQDVDPALIGDGQLQRLKMKMKLGDGNAINVWASNRSGAQLTTGTIVHIDGLIYGRWLS